VLCVVYMYHNVLCVVYTYHNVLCVVYMYHSVLCVVCMYRSVLCVVYILSVWIWSVSYSLVITMHITSTLFSHCHKRNLLINVNPSFLCLCVMRGSLLTNWSAFTVGTIYGWFWKYRHWSLLLRTKREWHWLQMTHFVYTVKCKWGWNYVGKLSDQ